MYVYATSKHENMQATTLLQNNLENAKASLQVLVTDLHFLRDQVNITQVGFKLYTSFIKDFLF